MAATASGTTLPLLLADRCSAFVAGGLDDSLDSLVRLRLLDFAANVAGGAGAPASLALADYTGRLVGELPTPGGQPSSAEGAAMALAVAAHTLEWDDTHQPSSTHPGAVIFAAALATAVELGSTFDDFALAVVVGYEVMCRIGEAAGPVEQYSRGFHPTGTCGVFGAAAATGVLLGLPTAAVAAALGLAPSFASGSMSFLAGGGGSKLLNAGHAASAGITVARLAQLGYPAPAESLAGANGFLVGHSSQPSFEAIEQTFGRSETAIEETSVKAHGCCRYEQGPIDALLALRRGSEFASERVEAIRVGMLEAGWNIVAVPLEAKRRPASVVESQFSMPFGAALAVVKGRAAPQDHTLANLADPAIEAMMDRVECYRDEQLDARYPQQWPTAVEVVLRDGSTLEARVDHPKGDPENPLSAEEILDKLLAVLPAAGGEREEAQIFGRLVLDDDKPRPAEILDRLVALCAAGRSAAGEAVGG
jgi:2-methylcitrate dehydratase PrpD